MIENVVKVNGTELPKGRFRALITGCRADEVVEGYLTIFLEMVIYSYENCRSYGYEDSFLNHKNVPKTREFFTLLDVSGIEWLDYEELEGTLLEGEILHEIVGNNFAPVISYDKVVAAPKK